MKILKALIIKEYHQIIRDPSSIIIAFILPLLLIFIFAYGVNTDTISSKVGVYNEDYDARDFISSIKGTRFLEAITYTDREKMEDDLVRKKLGAMMIIPTDFSENLKSPTKVANVQVITDGTETNTAVFVTSYIMGAMSTWLEIKAEETGQQFKPAIDIDVVAWYNKELRSLNTILSAAISNIMSLIGILITALVVAREWERGTMEALLTTRATKMDLILGKYIPYFALTMISTMICFLICIFGFDVPFRGSFIVFLICASIYVIACVGIGLLISTTTKNQFLACVVSAAVGFLPSLLLSGGVFEISSMPLIFQILTNVVPARYFIPCIRNLFLAETIWSVIIPQTFFLLISASVFFALVYKYSGKKLEK